MMPSPAVTIGAAIICPHGGAVAIASTNARVTAGGLPIATIADVFPVAGCAFAQGPQPLPCVSVLWTSAAQRVRINGQPPVLQTSTAVALRADGAANGPATAVATQTRVAMA